MNEFGLARGSDRLKEPGMIGLVLFCSLLVAYAVSSAGIAAGGVVIMIPVSIAFITIVFVNPRNGWFAVFTLNFFALGIYRYVSAIPWGLTVDILLALTWLGLLFQSFHRKVEWGKAKHELTLIAAIWFGYSVLELVNPEAGSRVAWFYAVRGISMYMLLTIPLILIIFNKPSDLRLFFLIWGIFSLLGSMKGLQQKFIGVDPWEQRWLNAGGAQHLLFGELRVFSFFSDAGTFGAAQGQSGVVFGILALGEKKLRRRLFYAAVALLGFFGMMISGTRGAMVVPLAGLLLYILMVKKIKVIVLGAVGLAAVFAFFRYTYIGEGNGTIRRMRTAFNPTKDASLQTRLDNQARLKTYLATRPLGGGVGSTGGIGQKYNPGTFLSTVPPDSWYVQIWMEEGIIGLTLHLCLLFYILGKTVLMVMFKLRSHMVKTSTMAMAAGFFGIMAASYGNPVFGQMPVGIILYTCMVFMFLAPEFDKLEIQTSETNNLKLRADHGKA